MNSFNKLLKAIATALHYYNLVQSSHPFPPFAVERRRWRMAKDQMFDAFDVYWGQEKNLEASMGIPWRRIMDADSIAFGQFAQDGSDFSVYRLNPSAKLFFSTMTDLLLAAAWTES